MRSAYLDELGRVIAVDALGASADMSADGPLAHKMTELLEEARVGLDPTKRYAEDSRWAGDVELMPGEYLAGGLGDLAEDDELRRLLDELEGFYAGSGEGATPPESPVHQYVELAFERRLRNLSLA